MAFVYLHRGSSHRVGTQPGYDANPLKVNIRSGGKTTARSLAETPFRPLPMFPCLRRRPLKQRSTTKAQASKNVPPEDSSLGAGYIVAGKKVKLMTPTSCGQVTLHMQ
ncbi:hypothetical protein BIW11_09597, partial [Tropilaelaps mercedesae]